MRPVRTVTAAAALTLIALASGIGVALATDDDDDDRSGKRAWAVLRDTSGQRVGVATFRERRGKTEVEAEVWRVAPGFHGFHVHAVGQCVPPFTSAGGHYNPTGAAHGDHAGDLPSLLVNRDGTGELAFETDRFSVDELFDADGSALIVHAGRDNYANIPTRYHSHTENTFGPDSETLATGDAGARAACGVVQRSGKRGDDDDD
ncbi:MAG TPA: superoxide dismutase family protein [Thermoleophilaceae bacterium]|nr:superoxide dismutase family protein [Thermoleophilaceae bacterium]